MTVYVKAKPPLSRRCRCGLCFDAVGRSIKADEKVVAVLRADPWLVVTDDSAKKPTKKDDKSAQQTEAAADNKDAG